MIINIINEFRKINNKGPVENWNRVLDDYCTQHCIAMINSGEVYHAPRDYLKDW